MTAQHLGKKKITVKNKQGKQLIEEEKRAGNELCKENSEGIEKLRTVQ